MLSVFMEVLEKTTYFWHIRGRHNLYMGKKGKGRRKSLANSAVWAWVCLVWPSTASGAHWVVNHTGGMGDRESDVVLTAVRATNSGLSWLWPSKRCAMLRPSHFGCDLPHLQEEWECYFTGCSLLSCPVMSNSCNPQTVGCQAPLSMRFSRQEYWSGLPFPPPVYFLNPGTKPRSPALQSDSLPTELWAKPFTCC